MLRDYFDAWSSTPSVLAVYKTTNTNHQEPQQDQKQIKTVSPSASSTSLRVEDRLQLAEKERRAKLELRKQQLTEQEKQLHTGRPKIDAKSSALAERRENQIHVQNGDKVGISCENEHSGHSDKTVFSRLTQRKPSNWRQVAEMELQRKKEEEEDELRRHLLAKPTIDKNSRQIAMKMMMMATRQPQPQPQPHHDDDLAGGEPTQPTASGAVEARMLRWKDERDRKRRAAEDAKLERERGGERAGRPQLNPTSVAIAANRRIIEYGSASGIDPVDDLYRRHQEHEERMRKRYEEIYGGQQQQHQHQQQRQHHFDTDSTASTASNAINAEEVTNRLFQDAKSRQVRREQQDQAKDMMTYLDPVTGEILFKPNINVNNFEENHNSSNRVSHRDPGLWDRLSKPNIFNNNNLQCGSGEQQQQDDDDEDQQQQPSRRRSKRNNNNIESSPRSKSPSISQYSKLLAEIHRGRKQQQHQQAETQNGTKNSIFDRLAKEEIHNRTTHRSKSPSVSKTYSGGTVACTLRSAKPSSSSSQDRGDTKESFGDEENHHVSDDDSNHHRPQLNQRSVELDPRKNERGMSRIESLLQSEKERQRNLELLQEQKRMQEESELMMMQRNHSNKKIKNHFVTDANSNKHLLYLDEERDDFEGADFPPSRTSQLAFFDRQSAWDAKRRQKVVAKQSQKLDHEVKECTFQPTTIGPAPIYVATSSSSSNNNNNNNTNNEYYYSDEQSNNHRSSSSYTQQFTNARSYDQYQQYRQSRSQPQQQHHQYYDPTSMSSSPPIRVANIQL